MLKNHIPSLSKFDRTVFPPNWNRSLFPLVRHQMKQLVSFKSDLYEKLH